MVLFGPRNLYLFIYLFLLGVSVTLTAPTLTSIYYIYKKKKLLPHSSYYFN